LVEFLGGLFEIFGEFLCECIFPALVESGSLTFDHAGNDAWNYGPVIWDAILVAGGGAAGLISSWLAPFRLLRPHTLFPLSAAVAPLAVGCAMWLLGEILRRTELKPTRLATFAGGAVFAFAMALTRWWLVAWR